MAADPLAPGNVAANPAEALARCRGGFAGVALFSAVTNLLMLVAPIYMLQIYDRVLSSASDETLIALTVVAVFLLACFGGLDWVRQRMMARVSLSLNFSLLEPVLSATFRNSLRRRAQSAGQPVRDLETVRVFLASPAALSFFDAPWAPVFTAAIFIIHPWLGILAAFGAGVILLLVLLTELRSRGPYGSAAGHGVHAQRMVEISLRHSDALAAMGMFAGFCRLWRGHYDRMVAFQARGGARVATLLAASKAMRQILQVGMLGLGAWLALRQEVTPGMMIAASIIFSRALAPIEQGLSAWRGFAGARQAWRRLGEQIAAAGPAREPATSPPRPDGLVEAEGVTAAPPGTVRPVLRGVSFVLKPGSVSAVIGPGGSGKSTLGRVVTGVWPALAGTMRLDGAAIAEWPAQSRLRHIGYMPQEVELFEASVAANVARLGAADDEGVVAAARLAGCHDMIMRLPAAYDTPLASGGANLSSGQRQRIGLARALYGDPALVVLDEPDANLDSEAVDSAANSLRALGARGVTVLLITHRQRLLQAVDHVMILNNGILTEAGRREDVLARRFRAIGQGTG